MSLLMASSPQAWKRHSPEGRGGYSLVRLAQLHRNTPTPPSRTHPPPLAPKVKIVLLKSFFRPSGGASVAGRASATLRGTRRGSWARPALAARGGAGGRRRFPTSRSRAPFSGRGTLDVTQATRPGGSPAGAARMPTHRTGLEGDPGRGPSLSLSTFPVRGGGAWEGRPAGLPRSSRGGAQRRSAAA